MGLASILATAEEERLRGGKEAVALADRACSVTHYSDAAALAILAAAHAENRQFPTAVAEHALGSARRVGKESLAIWIEQELERYERGQPTRRCVGPWPAGDRE